MYMYNRACHYRYIQFNQETVFESPARALTESQVEEMCLKYYNTDIHRAAFALPQFVKKVCSYSSVCDVKIMMAFSLQVLQPTRRKS